MAVSSVELIINAVKAVTALRQVDKEGKKVQQVMTRTQRAMFNLGIVGNRATKKLRSGFKGVARDAKELNDSLSGLRGGFARIGGAIAAQQIIETGISAIESERRIKLLTSATGDTAEALAIAERASVKFGLSQTEANVGVARLLARLKPMGMSLETIEQTFVGFNTASRLAGATASESAGAFLQLTQALGSGVLRGQELNSILEQAPLVAQAIAKELNVTVGALKKLGEEGEIVSSVVIRALSRVGREGADELAESLKGPGQQFRNLRNAAISFSDTTTQKLLPAILPVVNAATELLKGFVALPEPVKAIIVGTAALSLAFAALPPAILLIKAALVALKVAFLAFPFVAAAAGLVAIGVAAAEANKRIKAFNDVVAITGNTTKELDAEAKEVQKEIDKLAVGLKRGGRQGQIARKKLDKLNESLDKIQARKDLVIKLKIDVPFPDFANVDRPGFQDELNKLLGKETEAEKKARLRREKAGRETAGSMSTEASREIQLLTEQSQLGKNLLENQFQRADALEKINKLEGLSIQQREDLVKVTNEAFDAKRGSIIGEVLGQDILKAQELAEAQKEAVRPLEEQRRILEGKLKGNEKEVRLQLEVERIMRSVKGLNKDDVRAQLQKNKGLEDQVSAAEKLEAQMKQVGAAIENGIVNGIMGALEGTKSLQEAMADILKDVGKLFLQFAVRGLLQSTGLPMFAAEGGYVSGPTNTVVGEGGESEYIIPESKMRESMARYSRGARGSSVIPEAGGSGTSGEGGGVAVAAPIDVRYSVERINSVDYVTADQFQQGMQQAATQGAKQGEQQTLKRLQMSGSTRRRIGI